LTRARSNWTILARQGCVAAPQDFLAAFVTAAVPTDASAGCHGCYTPQPCCAQPQVQQYVAPPQYRRVQETVMVAPGRYAPVAPRCSTCGH
jgi:hypothetical protein